MGASHAEVGAYLLGLWGLPFDVIEAVAHHHTPLYVQHTGFDLLSALVLAQTLARHDTNDEGSIEYPESCVNEAYFAALDAPFEWSEAVARVRASQAGAE